MPVVAHGDQHGAGDRNAECAAEQTEQGAHQNGGMYHARDRVLVTCADAARDHHGGTRREADEQIDHKPHEIGGVADRAHRLRLA